MFYRDLDEYEPEMFSNPKIRTVGWIAKRQPFRTGVVDPEIVTCLQELSRGAWEPYVSPGVHFCDFCPKGEAGGSATLWIPDDNTVYVSPELIVHYIVKHQYRPPDVYLAAVPACPPMKSPEYFRKLAKHGLLERPRFGR